MLSILLALFVGTSGVDALALGDAATTDAGTNVDRDAAIEPAPSPPVAELEARRRALAQVIEDGLVVVHGEIDRGVEHNGPYQSDRDLYYLTGIELAAAKLIVDVRNGVAESVLFLPARNRQRERWDGPRPFPGPEATSTTGIPMVLALSAFDVELQQRLERQPRVLLGDGEFPRRRRGKPSEPPADTAERYASASGLESYLPHLHRLRQIKSPFEIGQLRRAIAITHRGLDRAIRATKPGLYEFQVEALIEGEFQYRGSEAPGFSSIVGSGPNNLVLHYHASRRRMQAGELLLMDVGAQGGRYSADISRTIPVNRTFDARQRKIYRLVLAAQERAIAAVRPGKTFRDINGAVRAVFREAGYEKYLPHGVCHHVGLDVHDVSADRELAAGMVITVEPGLYLPDDAAGDETDGFGVRIEDMVLVTEDGCEVLSRAIPKSIKAIEKWRRTGRRTW